MLAAHAKFLFKINDQICALKRRRLSLKHLRWSLIVAYKKWEKLSLKDWKSKFEIFNLYFKNQAWLLVEPSLSLQ